MTFLEQAIEKGYAELSGEGKKRRVHYKAVNHSERYTSRFRFRCHFATRRKK